MEASADLPELLDDMEPVEAGLGLGEVARLKLPDGVGTIGEEQGALGAVAALLASMSSHANRAAWLSKVA
jgi:hypothetical protein